MGGRARRRVWSRDGEGRGAVAARSRGAVPAPPHRWLPEVGGEPTGVHGATGGM